MVFDTDTRKDRQGSKVEGIEASKTEAQCAWLQQVSFNTLMLRALTASWHVSTA